MGKYTCFKAYDVRGRVPDELDEDLSYRIGRAYAAFLKPTRVVLGRDVRTSSIPLAAALTAGLNDSGVDVLDLGLCGTEQVYFYTAFTRSDGGIMVTASHNPADYNGMKFVREAGASPQRRFRTPGNCRTRGGRKFSAPGFASGESRAHRRFGRLYSSSSQVCGCKGFQAFKNSGQCR